MDCEYLYHFTFLIVWIVIEIVCYLSPWQWSLNARSTVTAVVLVFIHCHHHHPACLLPLPSPEGCVLLAKSYSQSTMHPSPLFEGCGQVLFVFWRSRGWGEGKRGDPRNGRPNGCVLTPRILCWWNAPCTDKIPQPQPIYSQQWCMPNDGNVAQWRWWGVQPISNPMQARGQW